MEKCGVGVLDDGNDYDGLRKEREKVGDDGNVYDGVKRK
jgi:hypothetical protein